MKLLIVTQTVNKNDPVLGFFHHWLEIFASEFEHLHVICLYEGEHRLPQNITVHSLGKEKGGNTLLYAWRFLKLAYGLYKEYDAVFVHMNPEYVALAGDFWHITKKPVGLWYNHTVGSVWLRLAQPFVKTIFHTSPYAYPVRYKNAQLMPAGIDTELFAPHQQARTPYSIYFQGRIAPAKRVHVLLEAVQLLRAKGTPATVTLVGPEDPSYGATLRTDFKDLIDQKAITFLGPKRNEETPQLYGTHAVAVNLTADGNFDKVVLEACATETPVIISSKAFAGIVSDDWVVVHGNVEALEEKLSWCFSLTPEKQARTGKEARIAVVQVHSLISLRNTLLESFSKLV